MAISKLDLKTTADYQAFISRPEHADRSFELIDGEISEKVPTEEHSLIAGNIYAALRAFVKPLGLGRVAFEVRHELPGDEHNALIPDVEFTHADHVRPVVTQGAVDYLPDLAVEVKSPDERTTKLRKKAVYYLENGVSLVWLVYPVERKIEILTPDSPSLTLGINDILDGGTVLPEFRLAVKDVFAE